MISFASQNSQGREEYIKLLSAVAQLSGLFSESDIPYINYRVAENVFCRSFCADNLSRSDTAFDARLGSLGIGLKTFVCPKEYSVEKIAEFNALSSDFSKCKGLSLIRKLSQARNERIQLANSLYGLDKGVYHIVARRKRELLLFETDYSPIDLENLSLLKEKDKTLSFTDEHHVYSYNYSKSTLYRKFVIPDNAHSFPIKILDDPYQLLLNLFVDVSQNSVKEHIAGQDFVILPLYSTASSN